jgi:hypothetical protein
VADQITLSIPREPGFDRVAHLVLSGLAVRLDLTVENLEDLQLALDSLFDRIDEDDDLAGDLTVTMSLRDHELETRVGPLADWILDELERDGGEGECECECECIDLRRVLDSTVDDVLVQGDTVVLTKKVTATGDGNGENGDG